MRRRVYFYGMGARVPQRGIESHAVADPLFREALEEISKARTANLLPTLHSQVQQMSVRVSLPLPLHFETSFFFWMVPQLCASLHFPALVRSGRCP